MNRRNFFERLTQVVTAMAVAPLMPLLPKVRQPVALWEAWERSKVPECCPTDQQLRDLFQQALDWYEKNAGIYQGCVRDRMDASAEKLKRSLT